MKTTKISQKSVSRKLIHLPSLLSSCSDDEDSGVFPEAEVETEAEDIIGVEIESDESSDSSAGSSVVSLVLGVVSSFCFFSSVLLGCSVSGTVIVGSKDESEEEEKALLWNAKETLSSAYGLTTV